MLSSIVIPSNNGTYTFPNTNVLLQDVQGLGTPDPKRGYHEYSNISGGINLSQYYATRRVPFDGYITAQDIPTFETARQTIEAAFTFSNAEKNVQMTTFGGTQVQGNAMIASAFQTKFEAGTPTGCGFHVELDFADPLFYSQSGSSIFGVVATVTGGIILPATLPFTLSAGLTGVMTLNNNGNIAVLPDKVIFTGPGTSFTLTNRTTSLDFNYNAPILAGDSVTFDFVRHTALYNGTTNAYANVSGTWWNILTGANTAVFTCGGGNTGATGVEIDYHSGFISL